MRTIGVTYETTKQVNKPVEPKQDEVKADVKKSAPAPKPVKK